MKKILLGVGASISVYKAVEIVRLLKKEGFAVKVLMTEDATKFVSPLSFEVVSEERVIIDQFKDADNRRVEHIRLAREYDLFLIAPATLDLIGKLSAGIADSFLSLVFYAFEKKIIISPAMNSSMYKHPVNQRNIEFLKSTGIEFLEPDSGSLACGEEGIGRLPEPEFIVEKIKYELTEKIFKGKKILITGGPTRERWDDFRFISNPSSGKTGVFLAEKARDFGGKTILITGKTSLKKPWGVEIVEIESAEEMLEEVKKRIAETDIFIMSAAVADFKPSEYRKGKVKKDNISDSFKLSLSKTPDILKTVGAKKRENQIFVGFSAQESMDIQEAKGKLKDKKLDMIVLNKITGERGGFGSDENKVIIISKDGEERETGFLKKDKIAEIILKEIYERWVKERK